MFTVGATREIVSGSTVVRNVTLPLSVSVGKVQVTTPSTSCPPSEASRNSKPTGTSSVITALVTGPLASV